MAIDVKKWLAEKNQELGFSEAEQAAAEKLLSSERFRSDFVPVSDFHSELDKQKNKFDSQYREVVEINQQWQSAYENDYAPALDVVDRLAKAGYDVSGLRVDKSGGITDRGGNQLTIQDIESFIDQKVEPIRAGTVDWSTFIADVAFDYRETYGKKFDVQAFRKFGYENRDKYPTLSSAYDAFTESDKKAKEAEDRAKWEKDKEAEITLRLQSQMTLPESSGSEGAPAFLAADTKDESVTREANRQAFAKQFQDLKITL